MKTKLAPEFMLRFIPMFLAVYLLVKCVDPLNELSTTETNLLVQPDNYGLIDANSLMPLSTCSTCTYFLPQNAGTIDGHKLNLKPGDVICLQGGVKYGPLRFINLEGTETNPITITNCGTKAVVEATEKDYSIKVLQSHNIRITGGDDGYGILLSSGHLGLSLDYRTTNFEVDHIEVSRVGFAGIMAKTDPTCDDMTTRENFTMQDVSIHDNFIHHTGGEGIYVGSSFYALGVKKDCGTRLPHAIKGVKIYNNLVQFAGWDGIQLGSAVQDAAVYNNDIKYYGMADRPMQNSGIQIGEGTGGLCYNNLIKDGTGNGITMLGLGDNLTAGNIIIGAGEAGIFCDDRYTLGSAFRFVDNIIINPKEQGIRLYSEKVLSIIQNNLIINPPVLPKNPSVPSSTDYVFKLNTNVKFLERDNTFTRKISDVRNIYEEAFRYSAIGQFLTDPTSDPTQVALVPLNIKDLLSGSKVPLDF